MCRLCVSALERLDKLERSVMTNLSNAVQCVLDYRLQTRRKRKLDSSGPEFALCHSMSSPAVTSGSSSSKVVSPDVAVSSQIAMSYTH